jgi:hypothetical protein
LAAAKLDAPAPYRPCAQAARLDGQARERFMIRTALKGKNPFAR